MEAIGTLAGGIATILGVIIGYGELIELFELPDNSNIQQSLEQKLNKAYRAKFLADQILAFSHQSDMKRQPVFRASHVKEAHKFPRVVFAVHYRNFGQYRRFAWSSSG